MIDTDAEPEAAAPARHSRRSDIVFTFVLAIALALAYRVRHVLLLLYVSALFAIVLTPVARAIMRLRIRRWQPGRGAAVAIMLLVLAGAITLFITFALPPVVHDMKDFATQMPSRVPRVLDRVKRMPFASHLNLDTVYSRLQSYATTGVTFIFTSFTEWASKVFDLITGVILTVYFMLEGDKAYFWVLSFFPLRTRERLHRTLLRADVRMGKWLLGQASLMLILGVLSTIVFALLRIRYAYTLGILMGAMNLIPIIGALISMSLVILAAAIDSWGKVLGACIFYAIYAQIENSYLTPRIMQQSVNLAGLAVIVALLLGSELAGVVGATVSVPTAVLVAVLIEEYLLHDPIGKLQRDRMENMADYRSR